MQVFFLAERPCILTLGGATLGVVDTFERSVELDPADRTFCTLSPLGGYLPFSFCIDEDFLLAPPPGITLYHLSGRKSAALFAGGFARTDQSLKVLRQERLGGARLTLLRQGKLLLDLETEEGFRLIELPDALEESTFFIQDGGFLLCAPNAFALLTRQGEIVVQAEGRIVETGDVLRAEVPFHDSRGHTALCEWKNGELVSCTLRTARDPVPATFALAFFESVLLGLDASPFLSPGLEADALREYLGDFRSVVLTEEESRVGLVYPRRERVFDVRYFSVETDGGRVCNIIPAG